MRAGKLFAAMVMVTVAGQHTAHAETVTDYITKKNELESMDHRLERYDRLIKLKEAEVKLDGAGQVAPAAPRAAAPSTQVQYFSPNGEPLDAAGGPPDMDGDELSKRQRLSQEEEARQARERERNAELNMLNNAKIVEVFRNDGPGSSYGAVLDIGGGKTEVQAGDSISNWKVTRVSLEQITLTNTKYDGAVRHIKHYR